MATLRQFSKGDDIVITITPESGVSIDTTNDKICVYPDNLDLNNETSISEKIKIYSIMNTNGVYTSTIPKGDTSGANMPAGDYTIELKYGGHNNTPVSIIRQNHAFTLVESGYNVRNPQS